MYDTLYELMVEAHAITNWFAFSQAMKVTENIRAACIAYNKNPEESKDALVEAANEASTFLRSQNTKETLAVSPKLESCLTQIRMEG
jgi:hypothetical protein